MKILIATDAWHPQINGVVTTLVQLHQELEKQGHTVVFLTPAFFKTFKSRKYPEIDLAYDVWSIPSIIRWTEFDAVHVATPEGPIGFFVARYCRKNKIPFTTAYHTKMPEYLKTHSNIPMWLTRAFLKWAHKKSEAILVPTNSMVEELKASGFKNQLVVWSRGADPEIFHDKYREGSFIQTKILLYAGRVSDEKNLEAFLSVNIPNSIKVVVGDGPARERLQKKYEAAWVGYKVGKELAAAMACADVFVFPSKTDTFGIVMIEAAYCGTPVAAYPVTGPIDFVKESVNGALNEDLEEAIKSALTIDRQGCSKYTKENFSWSNCAKIFTAALVPIIK